MSNSNGRQTHGLYREHRELYSKWNSMIGRCYLPSSIAFPKYGAKGITVCDQWRKFPAFCAWALATGWTAGQSLSVDRIDNSKGYYPENCRIATTKEQAANRRQRQGRSGHRCVERHNSGWRAYIRIGRRKKHLGVFLTRDDASAAVRAAEQSAQGF